MSTWLTTLIAAPLMLGILVVVHEFGHFLVAKLFGIGVPVFSVGMGPRLFGVFWRGTDYRLSAVPVGGYVRMAGADPFGEEDPDEHIEPEEHFMGKPVWQRFLVMLAGPAANLILPLVLFTTVLMLGEPQPMPKIGIVVEDSPAARLGLQPDDRIVEVDHKPVAVWADVMRDLQIPHDAVLRVERDGQLRDVAVSAADLTTDKRYQAGMGSLDALGVTTYRPSTRIGVDDAASPAAKAGLKTGDAIMEVDGKHVDDLYALRAAMAAGETHHLKVVRADRATGESELSVDITADSLWAPRAGDVVADRFGLVPCSVFVGDVQADSAAAIQGVKPNDRMLSFDGQPIRSFEELIRLVSLTVDTAEPTATPRQAAFTVVRDGEVMTLMFAPRVERILVGADVVYKPFLGIKSYLSGSVPGPTVKKYYSIVEAFPRSVEETTFLVTSTIGMLGKLVTGEIKISEGLGGPTEIFRIGKKSAEMGIFVYVRTIGMISISLGVFNLLPLPVLDGGQILFYGVEAVRGRPLSIAIREKLQMAGVLVMVALMLVVTVYDLNRAFNSP